MKRSRGIVLFSILTAGLLCFIFGNSLQSAEESAETSGRLMELLLPFFRSLGITSPDTAHVLVRKLAHFAEFFALGLSLGGLGAYVFLHKKWQFFCPAAWALLAAATDEFLQRYSVARGSSWKDVLLDFSGALVALGLVALFRRFAASRKK